MRVNLRDLTGRDARRAKIAVRPGRRGVRDGRPTLDTRPVADDGGRAASAGLAFLSAIPGETGRGGRRGRRRVRRPGIASIGTTHAP